MILIQAFIFVCILGLIIENGSQGKIGTSIWGGLLIILLFSNLPIFIIVGCTTAILSSLDQ